MIPLVYALQGTSTLPQDTNDGVVAAAYIVFFAIVLIYVAIMALRLSRVERQLGELRRDEDDRAPGGSGTARGGELPEDSQRERETV